MKVFLVFLAFLAVNASMLSFSGDLRRYAMLQIHLKALAEDCAAGGALFEAPDPSDPSAIRINSAKASAFASELAAASAQSQPAFSGCALSADTQVSYDDRGRPEVTVRISCDCPDLFRLPFISVTHAERTAAYRWEYVTEDDGGSYIGIGSY
jgi:hypothetical protein